MEVRKLKPEWREEMRESHTFLIFFTLLLFAACSTPIIHSLFPDLPLILIVLWFSSWLAVVIGLFFVWVSHMEN